MVLRSLILLLLSSIGAWAVDGRIVGRVTEPQSTAVAGATLRLKATSGRMTREATSGPDGRFIFLSLAEGDYAISATAGGFNEVKKAVHLTEGEVLSVDLQFPGLAARRDSVTVTGDAKDIDVASPDPAGRVFVSEDLLEANPGWLGAPLSIPGYPIETASSGIKAPQYFAPGVAGDHGEPIAQFIRVGSYLVPNNLSANAHGNGYADPNIYVASVIESVEVDGGAFNVREGNHSMNLAMTYALRPHLDPFFIFAGDKRDITGTAGLSPSDHSWIAIEGSYGNGLLDRMEHRKQIRINGGQVSQLGNHTLTLYGIGYYGFSYLAGLSPIFGFNAVDAADGWKQYADTIDPRQKDQTHTALLALNDVIKLSERSDLQLSGFVRTYSLALFSDFGEGLIRQSEFRTVAAASIVYDKSFSKKFTLLAGTDYEREAPRHDDLDRYSFYNPIIPDYYGPFVRVGANNVTIDPVSPYIAGAGALSTYFHYYVGLRRDEISVRNQDLLTPANSWNRLVGLNSPKAALSFRPKSSWWAPEIAVSFGKAFFTEDPRIGAVQQPLRPVTADTVVVGRSFQLVLNKRLGNMDLKLTLGHETQGAEYGSIDPDTGLPFNLGPGRMRYVAATLRYSFRFGSLQAVYEQADARNLGSGQVTPEAPRLITDLTWTYQNLPFHVQAKGEFEYVGRTVLGNGCSENRFGDLSSYCLGVANREFRLSLTRAFRSGKINVGLNLMMARGYTGQTTETFAMDDTPRPLDRWPAPQNPISEIVGVRIPSCASLNIKYLFGR